jgi:DNA adenine methylase
VNALLAGGAYWIDEAPVPHHRLPYPRGAEAVRVRALRFQGGAWALCKFVGRNNCATERDGCQSMKAPFPYFGGKSTVADEIWQRFGNVKNYVEPFAGSLAVLLARPHVAHTETVNDSSAFLSNFWRAIQAEPVAVAEWADWPVNEADLEARHRWLAAQTEAVQRIKNDPTFYDARLAGWWVWGICAWIGNGWCVERGHGDQPPLQVPHLGDAGRGINRRLPHLGDAGRAEWLQQYFSELGERLRHVRVACGDWSRVTGPSVTHRHGLTGVFLDPPYTAKKDRMGNIYSAANGDCAKECAEWAFSEGENPLMRIALCGYDGDFEIPDGWTEFAWKARGGFGSQGDGKGRKNSGRERIWFSPHCLGAESFLTTASAETKGN